jgi:hypothetical protein
MKRAIYRPSQVLRLVRAGKLVDPQPKGEGRILCEAKRHPIHGDTESPSFWENGMYTWCKKCDRLALARVVFKDFEIDLRGERKKYPLLRRKQ